MSEQPRKRQELYERIRQTGKEEFILEDIKLDLPIWRGVRM